MKVICEDIPRKKLGMVNIERSEMSESNAKIRNS